MPTLQWIGKEKVVNHHLEVPYRVLEHRYGYRADNTDDKSFTGSGNMIVHGDNLEALKALLPEYEGKVKCIYIDPPYNTGNEGWVYNDNVNHPKIQKWLGEVVGKQDEDFTRHDKWLCMMYPRLRLLQRLLSEDGAIFISIDDNEQAHLKMVCDEIFGARNFVANISWQRTYSTRNDSKGIVNEVEHILCYSKQFDWQPNRLPRKAETDSKYKNPDNDVKPWTSSDAFASEAATHQGMVYAIQHPFTGKLIYPYNGAHWRYSQAEMLEYMNGWCPYELRNLHDEHERALICGIADDAVRKDVLAIMLKEPLEVAARQAKAIYDRGQWPKFYFTNGGKGGIRRKTYLNDVGGLPPTNLFKYEDVGHTDEASKQLKQIFGRIPFDTPKPTRLIERILQIASDKNSIILDSFAGSGTTAHAVLNLNKKDGGNRKFILVEMEDYADSITAERVRRVTNGYADTEGTGGSFDFYELGETLFNADGTLNETVGEDRIREYVFYTETKQHLSRKREDRNRYLLDTWNVVGYYLYYESNQETAFTYDRLSIIGEKAERYIVYADTCTIDKDYLTEKNIIFRKIPRDIQKF